MCLAVTRGTSKCSIPAWNNRLYLWHLRCFSRTRTFASDMTDWREGLFLDEYAGEIGIGEREPGGGIAGR